MPHGSSVQEQHLAGLDRDLRRAASASSLSVNAPSTARTLLGHRALLLVRRRFALLVQRVQQRLALSKLPDHRSSPTVLRVPLNWLSSGHAEFGYAVQLAGRVMRPRLHAKNHVHGRHLAMGRGHVSRLRLAGNADRDAGW